MRRKLYECLRDILSTINALSGDAQSQCESGGYGSFTSGAIRHYSRHTLNVCPKTSVAFATYLDLNCFKCYQPRLKPSLDLKLPRRGIDSIHRRKLRVGIGWLQSQYDIR